MSDRLFIIIILAANILAFTLGAVVTYEVFQEVNAQRQHQEVTAP